ncbi:metallophosphoesterase [Flavobacterium sp. TMP13]|uniref:metallophosphoesterase n=1 Tax=Flavobacterium sp. TMP13 TaxID=3425950 RepID=UPI003D789F25
MKIIVKIFFIISLSLALNRANAQIQVTKKEINNSDSILRFAIVSDRTGGMEADIFDKAIDKLNLMQPEFVISVGDLIDGYTEDPKIWNAQWDEFDSMVNRLDMPFYYVPGNHDVSNELLTDVWRKRHGKDYYSFVYKNVLFISLNTDEIKNGGISDQQIDYVVNSLKDNQAVKWTLLFMHRPLWSYGDQAGYESIEKALIGRKYTVFSGHHHNYQYQVKNGMDHYVLATTGGGSWRRGADVGEFDHITWVTIKDKEPEVALIDVNGIYDKNLILPTDYEDIESLRRGNWLNIEPVISELENFTATKINVLVKNEMKRPMIISGELSEKEGIVFEPNTILEKIAAGQHKIIQFNAKSASGKPIAVADINNNPINLELKAGFERKERNNISLAASKRLFMDWKHPLKNTTAPITIDGKVADWKKEDLIDVTNPQFLLEDWDWKNSDDGQFSFNVVTDKTHLYVIVQFKDNLIISNTKKLEALQDKFYVHLNTKPNAKEYYQLEFAAGDKINTPLMNAEAKKIKGLKAAITKSAAGEVLEISIPLESIDAVTADSIRVNIGIMDHDRPENTKPSVIWWRPMWDSKSTFDNSGTFYK